MEFVKKNAWWLLLLIALLLVAAVGAVAVRSSAPAAFPQATQNSYATSTLSIDGVILTVLLAETPAQQQLGLGDLEGLPPQVGMLFVFPADGEYAFWMKDMRFSLDMIWMADNGQVVYMAQNVSPDTYPQSFTPTSPARYVLEVPAGFAEGHNIKVGDTATISL